MIICKSEYRVVCQVNEMNIHVHNWHNWLYANLTGLPFKRNDCSNISFLFHTKLLVIYSSVISWSLSSLLPVYCSILQPSVGGLYFIVFNQTNLVSIRNSNYLFTEEINNPNDLVLLKKENECGFAAAEQVRASNLTLGPTPDSFMNRSLGEHTDLLQDLLGVRDKVVIDQMLDSPNTAATVLGIHRSKEEASTA